MSSERIIIEVDGIDNSGKTTLIKGLVQYFNLREINVFEPPNASELCDLLPKKIDTLVEWFQEASIEEVVYALLSGNEARNKVVLESSSKIVVLDRGYLTVFSSCIARIMVRENINFEAAIRRIKNINSCIGFTSIGTLSLLLVFPREIKILEVIKKREKCSFPIGYEKYLACFVEVLDRNKQNLHNYYELSAVQPVKVILSESLKNPVLRQFVANLFEGTTRKEIRRSSKCKT